MKYNNNGIFFLLIMIFLFSCEARLNFKTNTKNLVSLYNNIKSQKLSVDDKSVLDKLENIYKNYKVLLNDKKTIWRSEIKVFVALMSPLLFYKDLLGDKEYLENINDALALDFADLSQWSKKRVEYFLASYFYDKSLKVEDNLYLILEAYLLRYLLLKGDIEQAKDKLSELSKKFKKRPNVIIDYYNEEIQYYSARFKTNDFTSTNTLVE